MNFAQTTVDPTRNPVPDMTYNVFSGTLNPTQSINQTQLECGPMPNVMVALPNTSGALCSTPQRLADARY